MWEAICSETYMVYLSQLRKPPKCPDSEVRVALVSSVEISGPGAYYPPQIGNILTVL